MSYLHLISIGNTKRHRKCVFYYVLKYITPNDVIMVTGIIWIRATRILLFRPTFRQDILAKN